jgi:hypothetical protein
MPPKTQSNRAKRPWAETSETEPKQTSPPFKLIFSVILLQQQKANTMNKKVWQERFMEM